MADCSLRSKRKFRPQDDTDFEDPGYRNIGAFQERAPKMPHDIVTGSKQGIKLGPGIPDFRFINRKLPIADVARALELRFGANGNIHCWWPDRHQHGDRTASVGIRKATNTVKCFGCDSKPLGPVDLVLAVLNWTNPGDAAFWIAERFQVPTVQKGRHLVDRSERPYHVGNETPIGLLVRAGL